MVPSAVMIFARASSSVVRFPSILGWAATCALLAASAHGAERLWNSEIQKDLLPTRPKAEASAPKPLEERSKYETKKPFEIDVRSRTSPFLVFPVMPGSGNQTRTDDRKEEKRDDMKRNWIFVDPDTASKLASGAEDDEAESAEDTWTPYVGVMEQFLKREAQAGDPTTGADAAEAQPGETAARDPRSATFNDGSFESEQQERRDEELFRTATTSETLARTLSATGGAFSTQPSTANRSSAWTSGAAPAAQPSGFGSSAFSSTPDDTRRQRTEQFQQLLQGSAFSPSAPSASAFAAPSASGSLTFRDYSAPSSTSLTPAPGGFSTAPVGGRSAFSSAPTLRGLSPGLGNSAFSPSRPTIPGSAFGSSTLPDYGGTLKPRTPLTPPPTRTQQKTF